MSRDHAGSHADGRDPRRHRTLNPGQVIGSWTAIGAGIGAALGVAMDDMGVGLGIGIAIGVGIGAASLRKRRSA